MKFDRTAIEEISLKITDGTHSTIIDDYNGECYLLSCKNIKNGLINIGESERRINYNQLIQLNKRTNLAKNDILITTVGTVGEVAIIKDEKPNYAFQRSVGIIKPDSNKVLSQFLYYAIKSELPQIMNLVKGAVQQCLFIGDIKKIQINLPNMTEQGFIASILSVIDDKIELNNKINKNLYA